MTKLRDPLSVEAAICAVADVIGWGALAKVCNVSDRAARNWADPEVPTSITVANAMKLDLEFLAAGGASTPITGAIHGRMQLACRAAQQATAASDALRPLSARIVRLNGEVGAALIAATSDDDWPARRAARRALEASVAEMLAAISILGDGE